ncbi:hypothetical protein LAD12857_37050 [Lacrimispora amygdalina]|uniref:Uncharacterized protein n=2 Tax=Lacrimispora amygdalina TaxID=253257 RepID=A0ABQ5MAD5_9FIRM
MAEVEITTSSVGNYQYTIVYDLLRSGTIISTVTVEKDNDSNGTIRLYGEIPNMTWVDTPGAGTFTYSVDITVTGTNVASASTITRALNAIVIG